MRKYIHSVQRLFNHLRLKNKLLLSFLLLIVIPLGIYSYLSSQKVYHSFLDQTTFSVSRTFNQSYAFLSYKLQKIKDASDILISEKLLNDVFTHEANAVDFFTQLKEFNDMKPFLSSFQNSTDIYSVRLYVNQALFYSNENYNLFSIQKAEGTEWYKHLLAINRGVLWCPSQYFSDEGEEGRKVLSLIRPIKNANNYREFLGVVRLDLLKSTVVEILNNATPIKNSLTYIQNADNEIIAASNEDLLKKYKIDQATVQTSAKGSPHFATLNYSKNQVFLESRLISGTDWYMITVVPYKDIAAESKSMLNTSLILLLVIAAVAYLLAIFISNSMTRRLTQIMRKMRNVQNGSFVTFSSPPSRDEIGELIENYNFMVGKISSLLNEQYQSGQELKSAELKALQSQINPHFLYNTLDFINWMSKNKQNQEIETVVNSLSRLYKLSLSNGNYIISIRDELEHVSNYFQIQQIRYMNKIRMELQIEKEILEYGILKITLQPIVENAILHGILCKDDDTGTITIKGSMENGDILLQVQDDGIGISEDVLDQLLEHSFVSKNGSGFGLRNIHDRIKLFYGANYGISFKSVVGQGTIVEIKIPPHKSELFTDA